MELNPVVLKNWQDEWEGEHDGMLVGMLLLQGEMPDDVVNADMYAEIAEQAKLVTGADDAFATYIDPAAGASGYGVGLVIEFLGVGADVIAWVTAACALAPKIKELLSSLRLRSDVWGIYLLPDALQVLVVAEICNRYQLRPSSIEEVERNDYVSDAVPERRVELQQMSSCSVFRVLGSEEGYQKLWTYVVTSQGRVVSDSLVDIPLPWVSFWKPEAEANRTLLFL